IARTSAMRGVVAKAAGGLTRLKAREAGVCLRNARPFAIALQAVTKAWQNLNPAVVKRRYGSLPAGRTGVRPLSLVSTLEASEAPMFARRINTPAVPAIAVSAFTAVPALAQDWKSELPAFRIGLLGGENEADRLRKNECMVQQLGEKLGVPVELYPASDYAGVMQGLLAGQLDAASLGASGYAGIYLQDPEAVEPIFVALENDGSDGYYAMM